MGVPSESVREFLNDSYQLISASTPTVPLQGNAQSQALKFLNQLLQAYSATGAMITIPKQVDFTVGINQGFITFGAANYVPTPDVTTEGRLANLESAWLTLNGVTYPLIYEDRYEFFNAYKYDPLQGLPRYILFYPETNLTRLRIFPAPSQVYSLSVYGKWQLPILGINDSLVGLPQYYTDYLQVALAKRLMQYTGRKDAWDEEKESWLLEAKLNMEAVTTINLDININQESWLNGSWRVRSGI